MHRPLIKPEDQKADLKIVLIGNPDDIKAAMKVMSESLDDLETSGNIVKHDDVRYQGLFTLRKAKK